jgi:hypothetical protein
MTEYHVGGSSADLCPFLTGSEPVVSDRRPDVADDVCSDLTDGEDVRASRRPTLEGAHRADSVGTRRQTGPAESVAASGPWVRPYVLTGGRTHTHQHLLVHTLVSVLNYDPTVAGQLPPESRSLYERAHAHTESVAELSAHCGMPLGVTRVLLSDLVAAEHMSISPDPYASPYDRDLLERVLNGLQQFA